MYRAGAPTQPTTPMPAAQPTRTGRRARWLPPSRSLPASASSPPRAARRTTTRAATPAASTGILPGDIITSMNGLGVGTDGTFKDYCDVIRTAGDKPIAVEVLRWDTEEVLRGEVNGEQELVQAFSFAEEIEDEVAAGSESYEEYVPLTDDTGLLTVEFPAEWSQHDTAPQDDGQGTSVPSIAAAPDMDGFRTTWNTPGLQFGALPASSGSVTDHLATFGAGAECTDGGIVDHDDGAFVGQYQVWESCGVPGRTQRCRAQLVGVPGERSTPSAAAAAATPLATSSTTRLLKTLGTT